MLGLGVLRTRRGLGALVGAAAGLLRALALDVDSRHTQGIPLAVYVFTAVTIGLYVYVYHVSMCWYIVTRGRDDVVLGLILFSLAVSSLIGVIKLLYMYLNSKKFKELVSEYLQCDGAVVPDSRMAQNVLATLGLVQRRAVIFWTLIFGNGVVYVLQAFLRPGRHLIEDQQVLWGLEPMFESPNYEIAMIIWPFGVFCSVYPPASITAFVIIIVGYNEAQLLALAQELLQLWDDAQRHYQQTIPIAMEFALLSAALIAELLGGLEKTYMEVPFAIIQVSMDCITGQKLIDANKEFEEAVYGCGWEKFDVSNMKLVTVMLQNAQKTMTLSAGGVVGLSYFSLMSIFKSIYSAYTGLRSTMKN